jgi:hypothetical protein
MSLRTVIVWASLFIASPSSAQVASSVSFEPEAPTEGRPFQLALDFSGVYLLQGFQLEATQGHLRFVATGGDALSPLPVDLRYTPTFTAPAAGSYSFEIVFISALTGGELSVLGTGELIVLPAAAPAAGARMIPAVDWLWLLVLGGVVVVASIRSLRC